MKIVRTMKSLSLVAMMLMTGVQVTEAKLVTPSTGAYGSQLVISKVFYAGGKTLADSPKNYDLHLYVELFNNSTDTLNLKGVYLALANSDGSTQAWTAAAMAEEHRDSVVVKQIFQMSPDDDFRLDPGKSVVIAQCAIDHSAAAAGNVNLSDADFEVKSANNKYKDSHNEAVPELKVVKTFGTTDFMNFLAPGPSGVMLLAADTKLDQCPSTFPKGKTSGSEYTIVPLAKSIDCVDIVKQKTPSAEDKRFAENYDAGFCCTDSASNYNNLAVVRKTAFVTSDGRTVLYDTNNSSLDFETTDNLATRVYGTEPVGVSDSTIVIPETGFLAINPQKPFYGPKELTFTHLTVSNRAETTDMSYNEFPGDSLLLIKGPWIAVGQPGEYTIKLSESQGVMKQRSSTIAWSDEDSKSTSRTDRMFYKFHNEKDKVGFKRVEAVDGKYNQATFGENDRLHIILSNDIADKIAKANGATDHADLDFVKWHGYTAVPINDESAGITDFETTQPATEIIYNLQGIRQKKLQKGVYIKNGKLFVK